MFSRPISQKILGELVCEIACNLFTISVVDPVVVCGGVAVFIQIISKTRERVSQLTFAQFHFYFIEKGFSFVKSAVRMSQLISQKNVRGITLWFKMITDRKIIFELFSGALQENPVRAPGALTGGALTGQGLISGDYFWGILFGGSTGKSCNSPGAITRKNVYRIILVIISP